MERVNKILANRLFESCLQRVEVCERDRIFCRHGFSHLMDVARIALLLNEEEKKGVDKELIYATALLHDCGRYVQYEDGTPHELAGVNLAEPILDACGFEMKEKMLILQAIRFHRNAEEAAKEALADLIYRADKKSRMCMWCKAQQECHKKVDERNHIITY